MIKKQSLVVLVSVLTLLTNTANAEIINSITENTEGVPEGSKKIVIEGTIPVTDNNDYVGKSVTLEVLKNGISEDDIDPYGNGDEFEYTYQTQAADDGSYKFEYTKNSQTGKYLIRIGYNTRTESDLTKKVHEYISPQDYIDFENSLKEVYDNIGSADYNAAEVLESVIYEYTQNNVLNIEKYNQLKESEDNETISFVCDYIILCGKPDSVDMLIQNFNEGYAVSSMDSADKDRIAEIFSDEYYINALGLNSDVITNFLDNSETDKSEVFEKLSGKSREGQTLDEVIKDIYNAIVLSEFDSVMWQNNLDVIRNYNLVLNVSFNEFEDLDDEKKEKAALIDFAERISDIKDIDEIADAFDEAVKTGKKYKEKEETSSDNRTNNSSGGNRGGSSGGGGGMSIIPALVPTQPTNQKENTQPKDEESKEDTEVVVTPKEPSFKDIKDYAWASDAIEALAGKKIISGDGTGNFYPSNKVTREEFVKMVVLALDLNEKSKELKFTDVKADKWYYEYVQRAVYYNLINGISEDTFGVGKSIKRADVAVILERLLKMYGKEYSVKDIVYSDVLKDEIGYAYEAIYKVAESKLMSGTSETTFEPSRGITRAETAVVIERLMKLLENN